MAKWQVNTIQKTHFCVSSKPNGEKKTMRRKYLWFTYQLFEVLHYGLTLCQPHFSPHTNKRRRPVPFCRERCAKRTATRTAKGRDAICCRWGSFWPVRHLCTIRLSGPVFLRPCSSVWPARFSAQQCRWDAQLYGAYDIVLWMKKKKQGNKLEMLPIDRMELYLKLNGNFWLRSWFI